MDPVQFNTPDRLRPLRKTGAVFERPEGTTKSGLCGLRLSGKEVSGICYHWGRAVRLVQKVTI